MTQNLENIDRFFNEQLNDYSEKPRQEVWEKISERMGHKKKRTLVLFFFRVAAGIALLFSINIAYNHLIDNKDNASSSNSFTEISKPYVESNNGEVLNKERSEVTATSKNETAENLTPVRKNIREENKSDNDLNDIQIAPENNYISLSLSDSVSLDNEDFTEQNIFAPVSGKIEKIEKPENYDLLATKKTIPDTLDLYTYLARLEEIEEPEANKMSKWFLGGQVGPVYSDDEFSSTSPSYVKEQVNAKEQGVLTYAGGLNISYSASKRLSVQSGIYYSKYGRNLNDFEIITYTPERNEVANNYNPDQHLYGEAEKSNGKYVLLISNSVGSIKSQDNQPVSYEDNTINSYNQGISNTIVIDDLPPSAITQFFNYIEIPLNIRYKFIDRKIDVSLSGGISTNILVGNSTYLKYEKESKHYSETDYVNTMNYNCLAGIGLEYPLFTDFIFNIEPKFRYSINPIYKEDTYNVHPYSFGIYTGITYIF